MEVKELETQTEREMAAVILEQAIEIRKLRLALKAQNDLLNKFDLAKTSAPRSAASDYLDKMSKATFPAIDPMAVDGRSVV